MPTARGPVGKGNYNVKQGDCIESIAHAHGLLWETVWNDPQNAELKGGRKNPNALLPGDKLHLRELREKKLPRATEERHRFRVKGIPAILKVVVQEEGKPRSNEPYTLIIDGETFEGTTGGDGLIEQELPPTAESGKLTVGDSGDEYMLDLRRLDPVEEVTGLQGRLANLGFDPGEIDGKIGARTRDAIMRFQDVHDIEVTGEPDNTTIDKLKELYP